MSKAQGESSPSPSIFDNAQAFPIDLEGRAESHKDKVQASVGGMLMDEITATINRLEFNRPCPGMGRVKLAPRTERWRRETRNTPI